MAAIAEALFHRQIRRLMAAGSERRPGKAAQVKEADR
jgi:hypothetical protein